MTEQSKNWLTQYALPLWLAKGIDREKGGFIESLSLENGEVLDSPTRAMVQARQIFSFRVALDAGLCDPEAAKRAIDSGIKSLLTSYSLPSGAFIHSIDANGKTLNPSLDLYTQAFALFGMANAYAVRPSEELVLRAKSLIEYLQRERRVQGGGFTEFEHGKIVYRSNPHMHLFEAAIYWAEVHPDPVWRRLADEVLDLCVSKFIDPATGLIGEYFSDRWVRLLEENKFVFEPGHQFEWAWLMGRYQKNTGKSLLPVRARLFAVSEKSGVSRDSGLVFDQVWSDLNPKLLSSRFWPQCERIKAASQLALENPGDPAYAKTAEQGMNALFRFFDLPVKGLWYDTWEASGQFRLQPAKASSLYHIIGAIAEYLHLGL